MIGDWMVDLLIIAVVLVAFVALVHRDRPRGQGAPRVDMRAERTAEDVRRDIEAFGVMAPGLELGLLPAQERRAVLAARRAAREEAPVPAGVGCGQTGLMAPQLHVTGGNLVTRAAYGMDPVTGCWRINAFPDRSARSPRGDGEVPPLAERALRRRGTRG